MPGYCFWNTDLVSGTIWPVISGLATTATVTTPGVLLPELPLEQAAGARIAAMQPTAASARSLMGSLKKERLMNEPPQRGERCWEGRTKAPGAGRRRPAPALRPFVAFP